MSLLKLFELPRGPVRSGVARLETRLEPVHVRLRRLQRFACSAHVLGLLCGPDTEGLDLRGTGGDLALELRTSLRLGVARVARGREVGAQVGDPARRPGLHPA